MNALAVLLAQRLRALFPPDAQTFWRVDQDVADGKRVLWRQPEGRLVLLCVVWNRRVRDDPGRQRDAVDDQPGYELFDVLACPGVAPDGGAVPFVNSFCAAEVPSTRDTGRRPSVRRYARPGGEGVSDPRARAGRSEQLDRPPPAAMNRRCGPSRRHRPGRGANPDAERSSTTNLRRAPEASRPA